MKYLMIRRVLNGTEVLHFDNDKELAHKLIEMLIDNERPDRVIRYDSNPEIDDETLAYILGGGICPKSYDHAA